VPVFDQVRVTEPSELGVADSPDAAGIAGQDEYQSVLPSMLLAAALMLAVPVTRATFGALKDPAGMRIGLLVRMACLYGARGAVLVVLALTAGVVDVAADALKVDDATSMNLGR
jgi:hypothetical protein